MTSKSRPTRRPLRQSVRFEVFKRDSFCCQYCGKAAPDVVLNCDHIKPVAKGGTNDILNLITACFDCNSGKSDKELSDQSALAKQKRQLDELNEKREQLELLQKYRESVSSIDDDKINYIVELVNLELSSCSVSDFGRKKIKSWIKKFEYKVVIEAIEISSEQYLKFDAHGDCTESSNNKFWNMVPRIATVKSKGDDSPDKNAYYVRAIIRNRGLNFTDYIALNLIKQAIGCNASFDSLKELAKTAKNWTEFRVDIESFIESKELA